MQREFVETGFFQRCWSALGMTDSDLTELQDILLKNPNAGKLLQNTGGARKIRVAFPGQGKSGSARVVYVDFLKKERIFLLLAYPKRQQDNLTEEQKKDIRETINRLRMECKQ